MPRVTTRLATVLCALLVSCVSPLLAPPAPAGAAVDTQFDKAGDTTSGGGRGDQRTSYGDIRKVRVAHGPARLRLIISAGKRGSLADIYEVNIDTDPSDPGPELLVGIGLEVEQFQVRTAEGFNQVPGVVVGPDQTGLGTSPTCTGGVGFRPGRRTVSLSIPRRCLGNPDRLRINVVSARDYPGTPDDFAPGLRRFGPWVASS